MLPLHGTVFMIQRCLDNCEGSFTACRLLRQERGMEGESINSQFLQVLCTQSVRTPGHPGHSWLRGWTGPDREPSGCCWASTGHWSLVTPSREWALIPPPRCALLLPWHQSGALGTLWRGVALDQRLGSAGLVSLINQSAGQLGLCVTCLHHTRPARGFSQPRERSCSALCRQHSLFPSTGARVRLGCLHTQDLVAQRKENIWSYCDCKDAHTWGCPLFMGSVIDTCGPQCCRHGWHCPCHPSWPERQGQSLRMS